MKIAFYTLGCKVNTYETESTWQRFADHGFERVKPSEFADVYVINTCTVTNSGDAKSRKAIRRLIRRNPDAVIAVMGCYSQVDPDAVAAIDGVDIIIGTKHRDQLVQNVQQVLRDRQKILDVTDVSRYRQFDETHVTNFTENTRAFLKIQDGCNNFCSYCIIPFARGPVRSRDRDSVLAEAAALIANGYHEIVLTGIHTGGYGQDFDDYSLSDLLRELVELPGLKRVRLSSIELNEVTDELLDLMAANPIVARHLHIPLQSGSDEILQAMRRKYDKQAYRDRLASIRAHIPGIAITTDVIVGFPGETDEHFEEMVDFIKELAFSELHVFPYSKRSGTKAAAMKPQINGIVKSYRVNQLLALNEELAMTFIRAQDTLDVLFETSDDKFTYGHSSTYVYAKVPKDESLHNRIVTCRIVGGTYQNLLCEAKEKADSI